MRDIIDNHLFSNQPIERDDIVESLEVKPKLLERKNVAVRIIEKSMDYIQTFIADM